MSESSHANNAGSVAIDTHEMAELANALIRLGGRLKNVDVPLKSAGVFMVGQIRKRFAQGGPNDEGSMWAPLKVATIAKRKHGGSKPLQDTGALSKSQTRTLLPGEAIEIGTSVSYAWPHHPTSITGYPSTGKIPNRSAWFISKDDSEQIVKIFERQVERETNEAIHG